MIVLVTGFIFSLVQHFVKSSQVETIGRGKEESSMISCEHQPYHYLLFVFRNNLMKRLLQKLNAFVESFLFS